MRKMDGQLIGIVLITVVIISFLCGCLTDIRYKDAVAINTETKLTDEEMANRPVLKTYVEPLNEEEVIVVVEDKTGDKLVDIPLDADLQKIIFDNAEALEIDPYVFIALMESESTTFDPEAKGDWREDGYGNLYYTSYGMTQIREVWWEQFEEIGLDIFNSPSDQIIGGMLIYKKYEAETATQTLMNYKCGPSRASELLEQGIVLSCVTDILDRAEELRSESTRNAD